MAYSKKNYCSKKMIESYRTLNIFFEKKIFLGSFKEIKKIPNKNFSECCFIGRSNVGKSSIINAITKSKKLAKTSKTPGRTQSINIYEINNKLNIVDLPGYGYAKISLYLRDQLSILLKSYLNDRKNLKKIYILIDCRVGIKNSDINVIELMENTKKSFTIILTKIDKCSNNFIIKQKKSILSLLEIYSKKNRKILATSSKKNIGIADIQKDIIKLLK